MSVVAPPRRSSLPGSTLELLVLAGSTVSCAAIDLASGALVRAHFPGPATSAPVVEPYTVVNATVGDDPDPDDPAAPEAVMIAEPASAVGVMRPKVAERWLRPLLHPEGLPVLGTHGAAIPYWELDGRHPSMALVESSPHVSFDDEIGPRCLFRWGSVVIDLPVAGTAERRRLKAAWSHGWRFLGGGELAGVLGYVPRRLLVSLTPPMDGHCYKVVEAFL